MSDRNERLEPGLWYLAWYWQLAAILKVYHENEQRYTNDKKNLKPNADLWMTNSRCRSDIYERTLKYWCQYTERDATWFPLSIDAVARLYMRLRKKGKNNLGGWEQEIHEALMKAGKPPAPQEQENDE